MIMGQMTKKFISLTSTLDILSKCCNFDIPRNNKPDLNICATSTS
jgi:hypothetical protein